MCFSNFVLVAWSSKESTVCDYCMFNAANLIIVRCLRACEAVLVSVASLSSSWGVGAEGGWWCEESTCVHTCHTHAHTVAFNVW